MRSPLTEKVQEAQAVVDQVNALEADVRGLVLDMLVPESEEQPKQKKTRKKRAANTNNATGQRRGMPEQATLKDGERPIRCGTCGNDKDYQDHFAPSPNYHEFDKGKKASASGD